jgi:hypothetical protein
MSKKSRMFLGFACLAMVVSLLSRFLPAFSSPGIADFAAGLGAALMIGVLVTWKGDRSPQS